MSDLSKPERAAIVDSLGLTVESVFVPFSQSRNRAEKHPSLNWRVTIKHKGRAILETDYSAGSGHAPSYRQPTFGRRTVEDQDRDAMVAWECENGSRALGVTHNSRDRSVYGGAGEKNAIKPDALDVLAALAMDSDVIDAGGFESWASDLGYDTDSRKAEAIYQACLDIALKLRAALGDTGLASLRNAFEGY